MIPLFANKFASVDHITPVTKGGENNLDNYVTSCWECNLKFGNKTHERWKPQPNPISSSDVKWDGLSSLYPKLLDKNDKWSDIINNS